MNDTLDTAHQLRPKNVQYIAQWSIDMLCVFLIQMTQNRVQLTAKWWIQWFCHYSKITLHSVNSISFCVKAHLLYIWITNTNLDKQGTWASFSRWFWDVCIQAIWGCHCVQTEDEGGILLKQNKHQEDYHRKYKGKKSLCILCGGLALHSFLTLTPDWGMRLASGPSHFTSGKRPTGIHFWTCSKTT